MVICTVIIMALLIIAMAAMSTNLADLENRIQTLTEDYADLLERVKACSKDLALMEAKVDWLDMDSQGNDKLVSAILQRVGALEDKEDDEVDKHLARE